MQKVKSYSMVYQSASLSQKHRQFALISGVLTCAAIILYAFDPVTSSVYPPSPFRAITGLFCPGCGTLRGLHQLLHGNLLKALDFNPLMMVSLPFLMYAYVSYGMEVFTRRSLPKVFLKARWIWTLLGIIMAYWILRNIPVAPFSWLAP